MKIELGESVIVKDIRSGDEYQGLVIELVGTELFRVASFPHFRDIKLIPRSLIRSKAVSPCSDYSIEELLTHENKAVRILGKHRLLKEQSV